jgi:hypothetical protein
MKAVRKTDELRISATSALPVEAITSTIAVLGKKGSGKTYTSKKLTEIMLRSGFQVVILDIVGAWWGLKSSADGKQPGFPIPILGGDHGDIALAHSAGEVTARAIVEGGFSCIVDLSLFSKGHRHAFAAPFLEALYRLNRHAMHLVVDEADFYAPQKTFTPQAAITLGAMDELVRRGRQRGVGVTMITQRPQVLNKDVLTQTDILFALRMNHKLELAAVDEWVSVKADPVMAKAMRAELPGMKTGDFYVWAPELDIFQKGHADPAETFDSSATPKPGEARRLPKVLADVDIQKLGAQIAATVEEQKANDPAALKTRIHELTAELAAARSGKPAAELQSLRGELKDARRVREIALGAFGSALEEMQKVLATAAFSLSQLKELGAKHHGDIKPESQAIKAPAVFPQEVVGRGSYTINSDKASSNGHGQAEESRDPQEIAQRKLLGALLSAEADKIPSLSRTWLAIVARVSPTSSSYRRNVSALEQAGLVHFPTPGDVALTEAGRSTSAPFAPRVTTTNLLDALQKIYEPARYRILLALVEASGEWMGREELAAAAAQSPTSSAYRSHLSNLRQLGLVEIGTNSTVRIDPFIFLHVAVTA